MKKQTLKIFLFLVMFLMLPDFASAAILFQDNFDGYIDSPQNHGWTIPTAAMIEDGDSPDGGKVLKFSVQSSGTSQYWSEFDPNPNGIFADGYIAFWAKEVGHLDGTAGGVKWLKLFSADYGSEPASYANVTFGQVYGSGQFYDISTGGGIALTNDTQTAYRYNGKVGSGTWYEGTSYSAGYLYGYNTNTIYACKLSHVSSLDNKPGTGIEWRNYWDLLGTVSNSSAPFYAGEGWHYYEYYVKHNTNDNFDGEFATWVDGVLKIRVVGMRNRNNANSMDWDSASLVNHVEIAAPSMYQIYFDDIKTSDSYMEYVFVGNEIPPAPPTGLSVQ